MTDKITTGIRLSEYIKNVIDEAVKTTLYKNAVKEKERQRALMEEDEDKPTDEEDEDAGAEDSSDEGEGSADVEGEEEGESDEQTQKSQKSSTKITAPDDKRALSRGDVEADDIIEKLNTIRSGKSFRDDTIKQNMVDYVEGLDKAERTALLAFLLAISQIVTAEMPADQVIDPGEDPSAVKMKKGGAGAQTKHIKPNVIRMNSPKKEKKSSGEDTSGPVPITPKK